MGACRTRRWRAQTRGRAARCELSRLPLQTHLRARMRPAHRHVFSGADAGDPSNLFRPRTAVNRALHLLGCFILASVCTGAAEKPVPAREEPKHKVVFENNYVRIIDVQIPVGTETLYHVHDIASVMVYLTKSTNETQTYGEPTWSPRAVTPGESRYAA